MKAWTGAPGPLPQAAVFAQSELVGVRIKGGPSTLYLNHSPYRLLPLFLPFNMRCLTAYASPSTSFVP